MRALLAQKLEWALYRLGAEVGYARDGEEQGGRWVEVQLGGVTGDKGGMERTGVVGRPSS